MSLYQMQPPHQARLRVANSDFDSSSDYIIYLVHRSSVSIAHSPWLCAGAWEVLSCDLKPVLRRHRTSCCILSLSRRCGRLFLLDAGRHLVLSHPVKLDWLVVRPAWQAGRGWMHISEQSWASVVWNEDTRMRWICRLLEKTNNSVLLKTDKLDSLWGYSWREGLVEDFGIGIRMWPLSRDHAG